MLLPTRMLAGPARVGLAFRGLHTISSPPRPLSLHRLLRSPSLAPRLGPRHLGLRCLSTKADNAMPTPYGLNRLTTKQWPWYAVASPKPGMVEEERVIFARPGVTSASMYWAMIILYSCGVLMYVIIPSPKDVIDAGRGPEEQEYMWGLPKEMFWTYLVGGAIAVTSAIAVFAAAMPTRLISRLAIVRQRPVGAPASETRQFIRMSHQGHELVRGKMSEPRELPVEKVLVYTILGSAKKDGVRQRVPFLKVIIQQDKPKWFSFDAIPYRLDFRDTEQLKHVKGEVVLSQARIEDVFGPLGLAPNRK